MTSSTASLHLATDDTRLSELAWHTLSADETVRRLGLASVSTGLSSGEAELRLRQFGTNSLIAREGRSWLASFGSQFVAVLVWLLIIAAAVSAVLGEWVDAGVIAAIVVINSAEEVQ